MEVCDTSIGFDRGVKLERYARGGIGEVWLVDPERQIIEVYREPRAGSYRSAELVARGRRLTPQAFPRRHVRVNELLG